MRSLRGTRLALCLATVGVSLSLAVPQFALAQTSNCQGYSNPALCVPHSIFDPGIVGSETASRSGESTTTSSSSLPFTGLNVLLLVAAGAGVLGTGIVLRRSTHPDR
jgi:hypothetical protein